MATKMTAARKSVKKTGTSSGKITDFVYSSDGGQIATIRGTVSNSIVILAAETP